jgi:hypothetical protein
MMGRAVRHYIHKSIRSLSLLLCILHAAIHPGWAHSLSVASDSQTAPVIVIGFVGGFVNHGDMVHSVVQVAAHLRRDFPAGVHVETFENRRREDAHAEIIRLLDLDHDGRLSEEEKKKARIILYGHSWGASETVTLARQLDRENIPVLLTIQVDSVEKPGEDDRVIPANVAEAVNFYQPNGFLRGEPTIRAADPARTHIIGNYRFEYSANPIRCDQYPWWTRLVMKSHIEIECDPKVWTQVEAMIRARITAQK